VAALAGCHPAKPVGPVAGLKEPVETPKQPDLGHYPARVSTEVLNVYSSDSVFTVCKGPSPFFEFDSAKVGPTDKPTMQVVANCMIEGPLKGKNIELIGRTDPRGTDNYNEQLGLERAERVKTYLVNQGIPEGRIKTTSLGKQDASPAPKDWSADRRVEIRLAQ
jgi:peptidoglycan-associated lipoprotein